MSISRTCGSFEPTSSNSTLDTCITIRSAGLYLDYYSCIAICCGFNTYRWSASSFLSSSSSCLLRFFSYMKIIVQRMATSATIPRKGHRAASRSEGITAIVYRMIKHARSWEWINAWYCGSHPMTPWCQLVKIMPNTQVYKRVGWTKSSYTVKLSSWILCPASPTSVSLTMVGFNILRVPLY